MSRCFVCGRWANGFHADCWEGRVEHFHRVLHKARLDWAAEMAMLVLDAVSVELDIRPLPILAETASLP